MINPVIAAPMAGVTDKAFRVLAREAGCGLVCTEMISDQALLYGNPKTVDMLNIEGETGPVNGPLSVQLFGSNPEYMAEAAAIVEKRGADIIDINMGCPTPKIVKNGEGAALMKDPEQAARIVAAVVRAVKRPVTVKMRAGWDEGSRNAVQVARLVVEAGAAAVTVHGRTRVQFYGGQADWNIIGEVKAAVEVPVVGNGDIWSGPHAARMMQETSCDAVMIGRAGMGNPWIFRQVVRYLETGEILPGPTVNDRISTALRHLELLVKFKGEKRAVLEMRRHASWYIKGLRGAARAREKINKAGTIDELARVLKMFFLQK